ncbi:MAG TPA: DUF2256 domain-containing protein [Planctomycetaceae bacterium]|nr:DUF2256 domain-containing protein [Planctomycetaceae bacterium]
MAHQKPNLPSKRCAVCGRPFQWRKKWANNWDAVKYCSERCRRNANKGAKDSSPRVS